MPSPSLPHTPADAARLHEGLRQTALGRATELDRTMARVANGRAVTFVLAGLGLAGAWTQKLPPWGFGIAVAGAGAYLALAIWHQRLLASEARAKLEAAYAERALARLSGRWHALERRGDRFADPAHLFSGDLDLFGQGSLFQRIDETGTRSGEDTLAAWLLQPASPEDIGARHGAVRELASNLPFRRALVVESRLARADALAPAPFLRWAESPPGLAHLGWSRPLAWALPAATLATFLASNAGRLPRWTVWACIVALLGVVTATKAAVAAVFEALDLGEGGAVRLEHTFRVVERERFADPLLARVARGLAPEGTPVSLRMRRFSRLYGFAELRRNQLHPVVNLFTLWDLHVFFRLERWKAEHGVRVRGWFEALGRIEALGALGGLAHDRPDLVFPEVVDGPAHVRAEGLAHPLLDAPVPNDVTLQGPGQVLLVTGSNMSGKSTLLRALGLNVVLALAGAPVFARRFSTSPVAVLTSMRVQDSLERGLSLFYAEVQRLKTVLDAARAASGASLFLLDEILLGTNTRERQLASREVIRLFLETAGIGAVTTHDLSLADLASELPGKVACVHFQDAVTDGKMHFDYRLRPGVVHTTNALRVLRLAGIPVQDEAVPLERS